MSVTTDTPGSVAPRRAPLRDINFTQKLAHVASSHPLYSPVTPVVTCPPAHVKDRKSTEASVNFRRRKSCSVVPKKNSNENTSEVIVSDEVMLNALVLGKAKRIAEQQVKQVYEELLAEKDKQINDLMRTEDELRCRLEGHRVNTVSVGTDLQSPSSTACVAVVSSTVSDQDTMTSPLYKLIPRLSQGDFTSLGQDALVTQLEMAVISGEILRAELSSLEKNKADSERDLLLWKSEVDATEDRIKDAVFAQREKLQKEIDELLEQQAVQLRQLSEQKQQTADVKAAAEEDLKRHVKKSSELTQSIVKLQQDLALAYRQKKQEAENCLAYQELYEESVREKILLEVQLNELMSVPAAFKEAMDAQKQVVEAIKKAKVDMNSRNEKLIADRNIFAAERDAWLGEKKDEESHLMVLRKQCEDTQAEHENRRALVESLAVERDTLAERVNELSKQMKSIEERHDLEVVNLQRTLDQREHDHDVLEETNSKLQAQITMQKVEVEKLRREVRVSRELAVKIGAMEAEMKRLHQSSSDTQKFLENEKAQLIDDLESMRKEVKVTEEDKVTLVTRLKLIQGEVKQLEGELDKTRSSAESMLRAQNTELSEVTTALSGLEVVVMSLCDDVHAKSVHLQLTDHEKTSDNAITISDAITKPVMKQVSPKVIGKPPMVCHASGGSFISAILHAASSQGNYPAHSSQDNVVQTNSADPSTEEFRNEDEMAPRSEYSLVAQIGQLNDRLRNTADVIRRIDQTVHHSMVSLKQRHADERLAHVRALQEAKHTVADAERISAAAQATEKFLRQRLTEVESTVAKRNAEKKSLNDLLAAKIRELGDYTTESATIKKLTDDLDRANKTCSLRDAEIGALKETLAERLAVIDDGDIGGRLKTLVEENLRLRSTREKLIQMVDDTKQTRFNESCYQYNELQRISSAKLLQAETALAKIDDKLERTRLALCPHAESLKADPAMLLILIELGAC